MEDVFSVAYQQTEDDLDLEYAFFGIFDGHGGKEAALFAKEHLMDNITKQQNFWSQNDDLVLKSIREGFLKTQQDMWSDLENWSKTGSGLPSTAGTTASIAFIRRGKIFIGHVGDSGIVMGEQDPDYSDSWISRPLTQDHKPECEVELARIEAAGGKVVNKAGVPRVVWNRPRIGHSGPVRRSTPIDEVPFLAVARALGDLWSYNSKKDVFVVSPEPDLHVYDIDISKHRCLVLGTDGAWNVLSPEAAVTAVKLAEKNNEKHMLDPDAGHTWQNPSKRLVDIAVERWRTYKLRADNTSVVVVMLDPPGPPRAQVLRRQRELSKVGASNAVKKPCNNSNAPPLPPKPCLKSKGLSIISRFPNSKKPAEVKGRNLATEPPEDGTLLDQTASRVVHDSTRASIEKVRVNTVSGTVVPTRTASEQSNLQVNEVTSSDNETPEKSASTSKPSTNKDESHPHTSAVPSTRRSISRELSNLALDSPVGNTRSRRSGVNRDQVSTRPLVKPKRRGRSTAGLHGHDDSDAENVAEENMVPASKLAEVEKKCQDLTNKLKAMEEKVNSQTVNLCQEVRELRSNILKEQKSSTSAGGNSTKTPKSETPRVLRSRNGNHQETPKSGTKRKQQQSSLAELQTPPVKRERTHTWTSSRSKVNAAASAGKQGSSSRQTRKSIGPLNTTPMGKLKRAKINLKGK